MWPPLCGPVAIEDNPGKSLLISLESGYLLLRSSFT
jgi:hypothetical protein